MISKRENGIKSSFLKKDKGRTKIAKRKWLENELGNYSSGHLCVAYLGQEIPKYHVLEAEDGWSIGVFYTFSGEYVPLEEEGEEPLIFSTAKDAKIYVDKELIGL